MKIEVRPKDYSENDKNQSFTECCTVIVKTTDDNGNTSETEENGCIIQGEEMIYLNAPKIYPSKDTPLLTEAPDIVGAINEVFLLGSGDDDWQPPADWLPVPEPEPYEMYFLVEVTNLLAAEIEIDLCDPENNYQGFGPLKVDWGDGTAENYEGYPTGQMWGWLSHKYTEQGQFLIKINTSEQSSCLNNLRKNPITLIMKLGDEICVTSDAVHIENSFSYQYRLHYVKLSGKNGLYKSAFTCCYALRKIDIKNPLPAIPLYCFNGCLQLKYLDFSNVEQIDDNALSGTGLIIIDAPNCKSIDYNGVTGCYRLDKVIAPLCISVKEHGFYNDYYLSEAIFADNCTFGSGCFMYCYNLYPHPDGSVT